MSHSKNVFETFEERRMQAVKIDIDKRLSEKELEDLRAKVKSILFIMGRPTTASGLFATRRGYHLRVMAYISDAEALAIQIICGSDPMREYYNMKRLSLNYNENFNVHFQKKFEKVKGKWKKTSEEKAIVSGKKKTAAVWKDLGLTHLSP